MKKDLSEWLMKFSIYALLFTLFSLIAKKLKLIKRFGFRELVTNLIGYIIGDIIYEEFLADKVDELLDSPKSAKAK